MTDLIAQAEALQTPLLDLLRSVPADARMIYDHSPTSSSSIPVGVLCDQAATHIAWLEDRVAELRAQAADTPAAQPVAWANPFPLIESPDPRLAELRVLVWETLNAFSNYAGQGNSIVIALRERIAAALKEGA